MPFLIPKYIHKRKNVLSFTVVEPAIMAMILQVTIFMASNFSTRSAILKGEEVNYIDPSALQADTKRLRGKVNFGNI